VAETKARNGGKKVSCRGVHSMTGKKTWPIGREGEVEMVEQKCSNCGIVQRTRQFTKEFMEEMGL
jgi:hypothetical protein